MSTIISLVVVGVCIVATTWLVLRDGGKPATDDSGGHRAVTPGRSPVAGDLVHDLDLALDHDPNELDEPVPAPPEPEPERVAEEPEPDPEPVAEEPEPDPEPVAEEPEPEPVAAVPAHRPPPAPAPHAGGPTARGARARASERVRGRRRDLGRRPQPEDEQLLVPAAEVPRPQPATTQATQRLRSGVGLVAMLVTFGISAAVVLGVIVVVVSDLLEDAVK